MNRLKRRKPSMFWWGLWAALVGIAALAQNSGETVYYYATEDLATGQVIQRGAMSGVGIPANLILAANARYRQWVYDPVSGRVGTLEFNTPANGRSFRIPTVPLQPAYDSDSDGDGLGDDAEFIIGTQPNIPYSDNDGLSDGRPGKARTPTIGRRLLSACPDKCYKTAGSQPAAWPFFKTVGVLALFTKQRVASRRLGPSSKRWVSWPCFKTSILGATAWLKPNKQYF